MPMPPRSGDHGRDLLGEHALPDVAGRALPVDVLAVLGQHFLDEALKHHGLELPVGGRGLRVRRDRPPSPGRRSAARSNCAWKALPAAAADAGPHGERPRRQPLACRIGRGGIGGPEHVENEVAGRRDGHGFTCRGRSLPLWVAKLTGGLSGPRGADLIEQIVELFVRRPRAPRPRAPISAPSSSRSPFARSAAQPPLLDAGKPLQAMLLHRQGGDPARIDLREHRMHAARTSPWRRRVSSIEPRTRSRSRLVSARSASASRSIRRCTSTSLFELFRPLPRHRYWPLKTTGNCVANRSKKVELPK